MWSEIWSAALACEPEAEELQTPPSKLLGQVLDVEARTPDPIPNPCAKVQLVAAKKLEQKLESTAKAVKSKAKEQTRECELPTNGKVMKTKPQIQKEKKSDRKPANGPMGLPMKKFIQAKRERGYSYKDALALWGKSSVREAILSNMSQAERKRRRF